MAKPDRNTYVAAILDAYRKTPGTLGGVRKTDRRLASQLFDSEVPLQVVTAALALAATRRINRPDNTEPLEPVRSLYYFKPVIDELRRSDLDSVLLGYLEDRLHRLVAPQ